MGFFSKIFSGPEKKGLQLIEAVTIGDIDKASPLLEKGADLNVKTDNGRTALLLIAAKNKYEMSQAFKRKGWEAKNGKELDERNSASIFFHSELVKRLVEEGADINVKDNNQWTALLLATLNGNQEIAGFLIEKGADIDAKTEEGDTALILALKYHYFQIASYLIAGGADINIKDKQGDTALHWTIQRQYAHITQLLIEKGADIKAKNKDGKDCSANGAGKELH
jgi:ankyrin repeat protein